MLEELDFLEKALKLSSNREIHWNNTYLGITVSIAMNIKSCDRITILIYLFGDNTWIKYWNCT